MTTSSRAVRALVGVLIAGVAMGIAACGSDSSSSSTGSSGGGYGGGSGYGSSKPATTKAAAGSGGVALKADESSGLAFDPKTATAKSGKVTLTLTNPSSNSSPHAIAIEGQGVDQAGQTASPGSTSTVSLDLKPGKYTFYCPVGGHRAAGMEGTLTVS
jgi:plastocyanin